MLTCTFLNDTFTMKKIVYIFLPHYVVRFVICYRQNTNIRICLSLFPPVVPLPRSWTYGLFLITEHVLLSSHWAETLFLHMHALPSQAVHDIRTPEDCFLIFIHVCLFSNDESVACLILHHIKIPQCHLVVAHYTYKGRPKNFCHLFPLNNMKKAHDESSR